MFLTDCAYDSDTLRIEMAARGVWANIMPMPNRKRCLLFSAFFSRYRNLVEHFFSKFKQFVQSQPDTTSGKTTSSPQSNSLPSASG